MSAYKAQSIASADRKGRGGELLRKGDVTNVDGPGPRRTFGSVTIDGTMRTYAGEPPAAMLADDLVRVHMFNGRPWPDSAEDRLGKRPRAEALKRMDMGADWPGEKERALAKWALAKLRDPKGLAIASLMRQGMKRDEAERVAAANERGHGIPDPDELMGSVKPAKSA